MRLLVLFCVALMFLVGCEKTMVDEDFIWRTRCGSHPEIMEAMRKEGYTGEHKLIRLGGFTGVDGSIEGSWGLFGGDVRGSISSAAYVKYAWNVAEKRPFIHTFSLDRIDLVIDDECVEPTIRYQFNVVEVDSVCTVWLRLYGKWSDWHSKALQAYDVTMAEMLVGSIISPRTIVKATIVISQEQLDTREYLLW